MARIRSVHPGLFTDEAFVSLSPEAQIFWVGLLCDADDQGIFEWKPISLKMRILPAAAADVSGLLAQLASQNLIRQFQEGDIRLGAIRNFCRYQRPKWPKAVFPSNADIRKFTAADGKPQPGPLTFSRDATATARQQAKRDRDRNAESSTENVSRISRDNDGHVTPEERRGEEYSSVAKATGASAPPEPSATLAKPDYRADLFRDGLAVLRQITGKNESAARSLIGRWLKSVRDDARLVLRTIEDARTEETADPVAWIEASLRGPRRPDAGTIAFANMRH